MKDKVFIDTNIFVYSALDDEEEKVKREKAIELLKQFSDKQTIVSTQILNEFYSVLLKHNIPDKDIQNKLNTIIQEKWPLSRLWAHQFGAIEGCVRWPRGRYSSYGTTLIVTGSLLDTFPAASTAMTRKVCSPSCLIVQLTLKGAMLRTANGSGPSST